MNQLELFDKDLISDDRTEKKEFPRITISCDPPRYGPGICMKEFLTYQTVMGNKTETRRKINLTDFNRYDDDNGQSMVTYIDRRGHRITMTERKFIETKIRYKLGYRIFIKEPYTVGGNGRTLYKYDYDVSSWSSVEGNMRDYYGDLYGWRNKLFMKRCFARHYVFINSAHVERLQDITGDSVRKEGVYYTPGAWGEHAGFKYGDYTVPRDVRKRIRSGDLKSLVALETCQHFGLMNDPRESFKTLIDRINGKGTWERNPFVIVYKYQYIGRS